MSEPLRIALAAEGPTDRVVIEALLQAILGVRPFVLQQLQPEGSLAFGKLGSGWTGVYRWCKQSAGRGGGHVSGDALLFQNYDLLILHVDADVAGMKYADDSIVPQAGDGELPCERPCPPASDTANALRAVVLSWCGEVAVPSGTILCVPSKSTETWVVGALFPGDPALQQRGECLPNPESRLAQQPKPRRIRKSQRDYQNRAADLKEAWPRLVIAFGEALRFQEEFLAAF
jgi:hypothetical protein